MNNVSDDYHFIIEKSINAILKNVLVVVRNNLLSRYQRIENKKMAQIFIEKIAK